MPDPVIQKVVRGFAPRHRIFPRSKLSDFTGSIRSKRVAVEDRTVGIRVPAAPCRTRALAHFPAGGVFGCRLLYLGSSGRRTSRGRGMIPMERRKRKRGRRGLQDTVPAAQKIKSNNCRSPNINAGKTATEMGVANAETREQPRSGVLSRISKTAAHQVRRPNRKL